MVLGRGGCRDSFASRPNEAVISHIDWGSGGGIDVTQKTFPHRSELTGILTINIQQISLSRLNKTSHS